jgi:NADH:ubiquinone reductase (non-electrogenic)
MRPMSTDSQKERLVIVGAGWAGYRLAKDVCKEKYDVVLVSPRNHFLFTPLLPSTAVGTLEFRAI